MTIGIIGAMEPEVAILKQRMTNPVTQQIGNFTFYIGQLNNKDVVLVQSGIGKVTSTIATTLMIQQFDVICVINTGSAGGFDQELSIGDVVISSELRHHDVDVTAFGYEMGQVPKMPPAFIADPKLVAAAQESIQELGHVKTKIGLVTTGDSFICQPERIQQMRDNFPTMLATEMEGASIAQTCFQFNVPFVVIRSLSDIAGKESPGSFDAYLDKASKHSSEMVMALLNKLEESAL